MLPIGCFIRAECNFYITHPVLQIKNIHLDKTMTTARV